MFEKLKKFSINYSLLMFIIFSVKMLVITISYADAIALAVFAAAYSYRTYLKQFEPKEINIEQKLKDDVAEIKSALSTLNIAKAANPKRFNF